MLPGDERGGDGGNCGPSRFTLADEKSKADLTVLCSSIAGSLLRDLLGELGWLSGEGGLEGEGTELGGEGGN